ncbi:hypothetical protein ASF83_12750 [Plantibacter sp. Leaf171]|nr:hypothetical protein ASE44_12760 [Plantibacter sp. Leaf1]KQR59785.1 hypothetical protein ASF83_12750 [Plantibacter sp. Leaf171]
MEIRFEGIDCLWLLQVLCQSSVEDDNYGCVVRLTGGAACTLHNTCSDALSNCGSGFCAAVQETLLQAVLIGFAVEDNDSACIIREIDPVIAAR